LKALLLVGASVLMAAGNPAVANTVYTLQEGASTTEPGSQNIRFQVFYNWSPVPVSASASYDPPVTPIVGCCAGWYTVSGSASDAHGGTAQAAAGGGGVFAASTLPDDPFADPPIWIGQATTSAYVESWFHLSGPASTTPVDVPLSYLLSAASTGAGSAKADLLIYGGCESCTAPVFEDSVTNSTYSPPGGSVIIHLLPNQPYVMIATAAAGGSSWGYNSPFGEGTGYAFVDPLFSLPAGSPYELVGLPDTATAPATSVPEPPISALLGAGVAIFALRRRVSAIAGSAEEPCARRSCCSAARQYRRRTAKPAEKMGHG
jgi:hypothetical protein